MSSESDSGFRKCTPAPRRSYATLAIRQAARHVSQFYDQCLAPTGLRGTQFSILAKLKRAGSMTINAPARELVMDRTTLGRNILPLKRGGLIEIAPGKSDRRSKEVRLTPAGARRFMTGLDRWTDAQARFEAVFGVQRAGEMRALMREIPEAPLGAAEHSGMR